MIILTIFNYILKRKTAEDNIIRLEYGQNKLLARGIGHTMNKVYYFPMFKLFSKNISRMSILYKF